MPRRETAPKTLERIAKIGPDTLNTIARVGRAAVVALSAPQRVRDIAREDFSGAHARVTSEAGRVTPGQLGAEVGRATRHGLTSGENSPYLSLTVHEIYMKHQRGLMPDKEHLPADPDYLFTHSRLPEPDTKLARQYQAEEQVVFENDRRARAALGGNDSDIKKNA